MPEGAINVEQLLCERTVSKEVVHCVGYGNMAARMLRHMVAKSRKRFQEDGFDLDLAYVTDRIIAMSLPCEGSESYFRNPLSDVKIFINKYHAGHAKVFNLCLERCYPYQKLGAEYAYYPLEDLQPPPFDMSIKFCLEAQHWLNKHPQNVIIVHCRAGKGRTGSMVCALLQYLKIASSAKDAIEIFDKARMVTGTGITLPSQRRFLKYFEEILLQNQKLFDDDSDESLCDIDLDIDDGTIDDGDNKLAVGICENNAASILCDVKFNINDDGNDDDLHGNKIQSGFLCNFDKNNCDKNDDDRSKNNADIFTNNNNDIKNDIVSNLSDIIQANISEIVCDLKKKTQINTKKPQIDPKKSKKDRKKQNNKADNPLKTNTLSNMTDIIQKSDIFKLIFRQNLCLSKKLTDSFSLQNLDGNINKSSALNYAPLNCPSMLLHEIRISNLDIHALSRLNLIVSERTNGSCKAVAKAIALAPQIDEWEVIKLSFKCDAQNACMLSGDQCALETDEGGELGLVIRPPKFGQKWIFREDVKFHLFTGSTYSTSRKSLCYFWLNAEFVPKKGKFVLQKDDLDKLRKDVGSNIKIQLNYELQHLID